MKSKNELPLSTYERARKRVEDIKGFYFHLSVYIIINGILFLSRDNFSLTLVDESAFGDTNFLSWFNWETYGTPLIWGLGLLYHASTVFIRNPFLGKAWEERQIVKYMNKDS